MDEEKDIQKIGPLSRFFDKHSLRTNPFGGNQSAGRAYRRAERIVAALYLVTNHIDPTEPIRVSVRSKALDMLDSILALRDEMRSIDSAYLKNSRALIRHLISLVRVLAVSGFLSIQNTNAVIDGLDELGNFLSVSQSSPLSENVSISHEDLLDVERDHIKDIKDIRPVKDRTIVKDVINMSVTPAGSSELSVREQGIVGILRSGGELGIRDISSNLPEYSEKMIQRDLVRLVAAGRVKKTGLKRWSRYSIVA